MDLHKLAILLGVPVVATNAREGQGLNELKEAVYRVATGWENTHPSYKAVLKIPILLHICFESNHFLTSDKSMLSFVSLIPLL